MKKFINILSFLIILVVAVSYFGGFFDKPTGAKLLSDKKIAGMSEFLAPEVCLEFAKNKVRAEDEWKGKLAKIKGQIKAISVDAFGKPYLLLDCSPVVGKSVRFVLPKEDKSQLNNFNIGDFVTGVGTVKPAVLGEIWVEDAKIVRKGF